jgi:hypothetical protein
MKKLMVILGLGLAIGMFQANTVDAQPVSVNININIDRQPAWGPVGYEYAAFYYFPALNIYFDVDNALFYYLSGRRWIAAYYLPMAYNKYDLYRMYKVVLNDYRNPWNYNRIHKRDYARYRNDRTQMVIRYAPEHRYSKAQSNTRAWVAPRNENLRSGSANSSSNYNPGRSSNSNVQKSQSSGRSSSSATAKRSTEPEKKATTANTRSSRSDSNASTGKKSSRSDNKASTRSSSRSEKKESSSSSSSSRSSTRR